MNSHTGSPARGRSASVPSFQANTNSSSAGQGRMKTASPSAHSNHPPIRRSGRLAKAAGAMPTAAA
jgi:hypothetical protein